MQSQSRRGRVARPARARRSLESGEVRGSSSSSFSSVESGEVSSAALLQEAVAREKDLGQIAKMLHDQMQRAKKRYHSERNVAMRNNLRHAVQNHESGIYIQSLKAWKSKMDAWLADAARRATAARKKHAKAITEVKRLEERARRSRSERRRRHRPAS